MRIALFSTAFALLLGTSMAFAFARYRFFGREALNFAVTLPIILPGVITGVALASFFLFAKNDLSIRTVIIGHTTFCIVLVFNNVLARLRRLSPSLEEASRDLGASGWQTFRYVTFPSIRTALVAGALLSLALSFDEIAVTFFLAGSDTTTLPLWILGAFRNRQALPEVNAVATVILLVSLPMIAIAAYLMRDEGSAPRDQGVTHVIDTGLSTVEAEGLMASAGDYVDLVRLGWGSAYVTRDVRAKVERYQAAGVPVMLGGTLTELAWLRGKLDGLTDWLDELGIEHVEVSSGTVRMPAEEKLRLIESLAERYTVFAEVGEKDPTALLAPVPLGADDQGRTGGGGALGGLRGPRDRRRRPVPPRRRGAHRPDRRDPARGGLRAAAA